MAKFKMVCNRAREEPSFSLFFISFWFYLITDFLLQCISEYIDCDCALQNPFAKLNIILIETDCGSGAFSPSGQVF